MEQRDSGFYQVAYIDDIEKQAARFDIVVGSGRKGQSIYPDETKKFISMQK